MKELFAPHLPRRGCKKNDSILSSFLGGGQWGGLGDVAHVTDPGQTNGQGPVLFFRQKAALEDPGQTNGQGPVLFLGKKQP